MTEKELLKLKKSELLEIMLAQSKEIDSLRAQLEGANAELRDKRIAIEESGSIAEASLKLTKIFIISLGIYKKAAQRLVLCAVFRYTKE